MRTDRNLLVTACAVALAACGGGGGGGGLGSIPPPPSAPAGPAPVIVDIIPGTNQSTSFAALGMERPTGGGAVTTEGFQVAFDASTGTYVMDFPSSEAGSFYPSNYSDSEAYSGGLAGVPASGSTSVYVIAPTNSTLPMAHTGLAAYSNNSGSGWVAFGAATPASAVPVTGTATFDAMIRGTTMDTQEWVNGDASLSFDFAAGTLSGHIHPQYFSEYDWNVYDLGQYDFVNTVYSAGSSSFSGELSNPSFVQNGSFSGMFTGPAAQELMARWTIPYRHPNGTADSTVIGVLVGRR